MNSNNNNTLTLTVVDQGFMAGAVDRVNANGVRLGKTLSYIGSAPAGDIKKALVAKGLKGKALKAEIASVLRGEKDMAWALYEAQVSVARSMNFVPVHTKANKNADMLTTRFEKAPPTPEEVARTCAAALPAKELVSMAAERMDNNAILALIAELEKAKAEKAKQAQVTEVKSEVTQQS